MNPSAPPPMQPQTLDHAGIAARVPHSGSMCLLHRLRGWSAEHIECSATSHRDPANPLRTQGVLLAVSAIEYAAQAMALHGALSAEMSAELSAELGAELGAKPGAAPTPGFLASVRAVKLHVPRLDTVAGALRIVATRHAGDTRQALYAFTLHDERGALLVDGRATVVLNALP